MEVCFKCNQSDEEVRLFEGVNINEIVHICERCALLEGIPLLKNPSVEQLKVSEKSGPMYSRLKRLSGIREEPVRKSIFEELKEAEERGKILAKSPEKPIKFVENFHWAIQHARRHKGLTHKQLADLIGESEVALRLIERNNLPEHAELVIKKLEQYFRIKLIELTEQEKNQIKANKIVQDSYDEIILNPEGNLRENSSKKVDDFEFRKKIESDIKLNKIKRETESDWRRKTTQKVRMRAEEENDMVKEAIRTESPEIRKHEQVDGNSLRVLDFKKERLNAITIADLKEIQRNVEKDFPTKSSLEVGREQTENFGKEDTPVSPYIAKKKWFNRYVEKKSMSEEKINSGQGAISEKTPTIHELMAQKKDRERYNERQEVMGKDIELVEEEE